MSPTAQLDAYQELSDEVRALALADAAQGASFEQAYAQRWDAALRRMQREDPQRFGRVRRDATLHITYKIDPTLPRHERRRRQRELRSRGH